MTIDPATTAYGKDANQERSRVYLSVQDWCALLALALAVLVALAGVWQSFNELKSSIRESQAIFKTEIDHLKKDVETLRVDVKEFVKGR